MIKKISNVIFIILFFVLLCTPMLFADYSSETVLETENRKLAATPQLFENGKLNDSFSTDVESWVMDRMGFRQNYIRDNARLQYRVFHRFNGTDYRHGRNGDYNYATPEIIEDYAHMNLRSEETLQEIADSFQIINDYLEEQGTQFYYVQCYDKHSIYPEQFLDTINQYGDLSKTEQTVNYIREHTDVNVISLKDAMIEGKKNYETYSHWGDPTHWNDRGAFIGYQTVMNEINACNGNVFPVLQEEDFDITMVDEAVTPNYYKYAVDIQESFTLRDPKSEVLDASELGSWTQDEGNTAWKNDSIDSDVKVLLLCDSYFASFNKDYFAESFPDLKMLRLIYNNYIYDLPEIVEEYKPDIVIIECAERVDRTWSICKVAERLGQS